MKKRYSKLFRLQAMFIVIAILYGSTYLFFIKRGLSGDSFFHYLNLKDAYLSLTQGHWPQFNLHSGYLFGGATNTFYPWLMFLPFVMVIHIIPPLQWWGLAISIGMLIGLNISTWVGRKWLHSLRAGVYLSLFYCLSTIVLSEIYGQGDLSSYYAMMVAPLAFYGWHEWLLHDYWKLLAISLAVIMYLHTLTALILIASFIILTIFQYSSLTEKKIYNGFKCALVFTCLTAAYWGPMLILRGTNRIFVPISKTPVYVRSQMPFFSWTDLTVPYTANIWGAITVASLIAVILHYKVLSHELWSYMAVCILFLMANNYSVNSWLIRHAPFDTLQFMHRICFITIFYFSLILIRLGQHHVLHFKRYAAFVFIFTIPLLLIGCSEKIYQTCSTPSLTNIEQVWALKQTPLNYTPADLSSVRFLRALPKRYPDYYPKDLVTHYLERNYISKSVQKEIPLLRKPTNLPELISIHQSNINLTDSSLVIHSKGSRNVTLPVALYHQQNYQIYDNHQRIAYHYSHHLLSCHLHKGNNVIKVIAPLMWYRYVTIGISFITLAVLLLRKRSI